MSNNPFATFFASFKSLFGPKQAAENSTGEQQSELEVVESVEKSPRPNSSYTRLQTLPAAKSPDNPAFSRQGHDQMYQASKGGANATSAPRRTSSTFTKLQALSASGTGAAANEPLAQDHNLNSLLERLDQD